MTSLAKFPAPRDIMPRPQTLGEAQVSRKADAERANEETLRKYRAYINPGLADLLRFIGYGAVESRAEGVIVWDSDGREYLDFLAGFGMFALGHRPPSVLKAVREQLDRAPMSSRLLLGKPAADLAELLVSLAPGSLRRVFFTNSGAEAVEGALKIARAATGRKQIVAAENAFHGKTLGALSASGRPVYKEPFEPLLPGFAHVPFGDAKALEKAVSQETAAVILEPIQGEAGVIIPGDDYLPAAREICDRAGALLILDEVQTGLGRTGKMFACEHWGVAPDIMALAKALSGGVIPIGAFMAREELWKPLEENPLLHSSTFGGGGLACAAGLAAVKAILQDDLPSRANRLGRQLLDELRSLQRKHEDSISEVRGLGLMIGVEFTDSDVAGLAIAGLAQRRILVGYTLNNPKVMRIQPPLVVSEQHVARFLQALSESLDQTRELVKSVQQTA